MGVKIAGLRQRIKIQQMTRVADGQGGWTESWSDFAEVWSQINPKSARERYFADQVQPTISHEIAIRHLSGVKTEMRILFIDRVFQIHGVRAENEEKWFMYLDCEEGVAS